ncbi:four-carbon acid sugar kinase family protein [Brenneria corticis]|nr:four-carbon acid sugar kinase family protein [Brenneria sp. CFCC 11842]
MIDVGIVADDLTGANTNCSLFAPLPGVSAISIFGSGIMDENIIHQHNVVAISTNSRALSSPQAENIVFRACQALAGKRLLSKRVDSTLRGNIGCEIAAVLKARTQAIAVVVAAFPVSGRITRQGTLYVNNVPVAETAAGQDIKMPVTDSRVATIIRQQFDVPILSVDIQVTEQGSHAIHLWLSRYYHNEKVVVFDAATDEQITAIAQATYRFFGNNIIPVDPGPYTYALAQIISHDIQQKIAQKHCLVAIGSVSNNTLKQIASLKASHRCFLAKINCRNLMASLAARKAEEQRVITEIETHLDNEVIGLVSAEELQDIIPLNEIARNHYCSVDDVSDIINRSIATIICTLLGRYKDRLYGLYTSGGDISEAICQQANINALQVIGAVMPQVLNSRIIGGPYHGVHMISKGGLIGASDIIPHCLTYLKRINEELS